MKSMQSVLTLTKRNLAALLMGMVALAGVANAEGHAHKGKTGNLKIAIPTEVAGTILQPGDYSVREVQTPDGAVVEFVQERYDPTALDGISPYDEEVIVQVRASERALSAPTKHTQLESEGAGRAVALHVKGDTVEYLFEPSSEAKTAGAMANRAESSQ